MTKNSGQCTQSVGRAAPKLIKLVIYSVKNSPAQAVQALMAIIEELPDFAYYCFDKQITLSQRQFDTIECGANIIAIAAQIAHVAVKFQDIMGDVNALRNMVSLLPNTIAVCTEAFNDY